MDFFAKKSEVRAHQMARKLRSAGFTPQKIRGELSSNGCPLELRTAGFTPYFHAELPSNCYAQRRPSTESFRKLEGLRLPRSSPLLCVMRMKVSGRLRVVFAVTLVVYLASGSARTHRSTALRDCVRRFRY